MNKSTFKKSYTQFHIITKPIYEIILKQLKDKGEINELEKLNKNFLMNNLNPVASNNTTSITSEQLPVTMPDNTDTVIQHTTPPEAISDTKNQIDPVYPSAQTSSVGTQIDPFVSTQSTQTIQPKSVSQSTQTIQPKSVPQSTQSIQTPSMNNLSAKSGSIQAPNIPPKTIRTRKYQCDYCEKVFTTSFAKKRHSNNFHRRIPLPLPLEERNILQKLNKERKDRTKSRIPRPIKKELSNKAKEQTIKPIPIKKNETNRVKSRIPVPIKKIFKNIDKEKDSRMKRKRRRVEEIDSEIPLKQLKTTLGVKRKRKDDEKTLMPPKKRKFQDWT